MEGVYRNNASICVKYDTCVWYDNLSTASLPNTKPLKLTVIDIRAFKWEVSRDNFLQNFAKKAFFGPVVVNILQLGFSA